MLLPLMLMAVMSISAQSIIGTWKSAKTTDSDGDDDVQFTRVK